MAEMLSIINPATEQLIKEIPVDDSATIADKVKQARSAQPAWAARPLAERIEAIKTFRDALAEQADSLAATLTAETGKPITQAKNEILGTPSRIDFFIENVARVLRAQRVYQDPWQA
ncbi:MAG: aldehyde dehydrogenase family protein, partial [Cyanobacteria bacterium P01_A01_bin.137]